MAEATLNGVNIAYQQMGEGPDLVLVHGLAASRAFWFLHYAVPLSRHFRVTLFDLRGHGYSGVPASGYDAVTMSRDLAALLDHLDISSCVLLGHSYGGGVALEYAGRHPRRVSQLVIMDTKVNRLQPEQKLSDSPHLSPFEIEIAAKSGHDWDNEKQVGLLFLEVLARWRIQGGESTTRDAFTPFGEAMAGAARQHRRRRGVRAARARSRSHRGAAHAAAADLRRTLALPADLPRPAAAAAAGTGGTDRTGRPLLSDEPRWRRAPETGTIPEHCIAGERGRRRGIRRRLHHLLKPPERN